METRPWKRERIIELPRSQRSTEPLPMIAHALYCGACGASRTHSDVFCGICGMSLREDILRDDVTVPFGLTGISWQRR